MISRVCAVYVLDPLTLTTPVFVCFVLPSLCTTTLPTGTTGNAVYGNHRESEAPPTMAQKIPDAGPRPTASNKGSK